MKEIRFCKDCMYCHIREPFYKCTSEDALEYYNLVTKEPPLCDDMRSTAVACGEYGRWFIGKDELPIETV